MFAICSTWPDQRNLLSCVRCGRIFSNSVSTTRLLTCALLTRPTRLVLNLEIICRHWWSKTSKRWTVPASMSTNHGIPLSALRLRTQPFNFDETSDWCFKCRCLYSCRLVYAKHVASNSFRDHRICFHHLVSLSYWSYHQSPPIWFVLTLFLIVEELNPKALGGFFLFPCRVSSKSIFLSLVTLSGKPALTFSFSILNISKFLHSFPQIFACFSQSVNLTGKRSHLPCGKSHHGPWTLFLILC